MKQDKLITTLILALMGVVIAFLILNCRRDARIKQKTETLRQSVATATTEDVVPKPATTTTQDLSVIVKDKGASIVMAPILSKQPTIVPESAVRAMQKTNKQ